MHNLHGDNMKRIFLSLIFLFALSANAFGAGTCGSADDSSGTTHCTGTTPWTADSASYADVNHCVNTCASADETINVPAGSATWSSQLEVTRGKYIIGGSGGTTTITSNFTKANTSGDQTNSTNALIEFIPNADARTNNDHFQFSNFTVHLDSKCFFIALTNQSATRVTNVRIDHNIVDYSSSRTIVVYGNVGGVIDNNTFDHCGLTLTLYGMNANWTNGITHTPATGNYMYFEDNTISNITFTPHDGGIGAEGVVRYNTYNAGSTNLSPWFDMHGNGIVSTAPTGLGGNQGGLGCEVYGNVVNDTNNAYIGIRGGQSFIYMNNFIGRSQNNYFREEILDGATNPTYPWNTTDGTPQYVHDSYMFLNFANNTTHLTSGISGTLNYDTYGGDEGVVPQWDRDAWRDYGTFNGTSGVGCGTTKPGTCTVGVAFWETSQSCSNLTDYAGASPTTPISGTLYKCTATNTWTAYYTPYTYPHPLRSETDTTAPTATWAIYSTGLIATATFSETVNATTKTGVSFTGTVTGAIGATYKDGMPGGIVRYDLDAEVQQAETIVVDYTTPGDGIKDLAGNALADISDGAVSNNSTQADPPLVTLTIGAHAGSTVNVYPGINCGSTCGPVEYDTGTVLTVSVTALPNYTGCTIGGTGCGASTTMSEARSCTVTCTKIAPDYTLGSGATVTIGSGAAATIQ